MDLKLNFASLFVLSSHGTCCNRKFYLHPFGRNIQDLSIPTFALSGSGMSASFNRRHRQFLPLCGCHFGPLSECGQPSLNLDNQLSLGKDSNLALNLIATPQRHPWASTTSAFRPGHRSRPSSTAEHSSSVQVATYRWADATPLAKHAGSRYSVPRHCSFIRFLESQTCFCLPAAHEIY